MTTVTMGYEFLRQSLSLSAFPVKNPAIVRPVTRVEVTDSILSIPKQVAVSTDDPLAHVLFALKHEGTNLQVLSEALPKIAPSSLISELRRSPTGAYARVAGYLWEHFTGKQLTGLPELYGATADVFNPKKYITGESRRDTKWRVAFNGLGTIDYCPTVERTDYLHTMIQSDILGKTAAFLNATDEELTDRALAWAYLNETESSFAIERESPGEDKSRLFVSLLHQAHDRRHLTESYLVSLQNSVITNPYEKAVSFRLEQNWLRGPLRGAAGITYLPPPPEMVPDLMGQLMRLCNTPIAKVDPIVMASIASFGFVYIHPFMDGNGRLARFLFHQALCQSGRLEEGLLLPVSAAMKRHESEYLSVLREYSRPARDLWTVQWIDHEQYDFRFNGMASAYQYWNATRCVEFGYKMADEALEVDIRKETEFLDNHDKILKQVNQEVDVRESTLSALIRFCLNNHGAVSKNRRKQYAGQVPERVFDLIECCTREQSGMGADTSAVSDEDALSGWPNP